MPFFISGERYSRRVSREAMQACEMITHELGAEIHDDLIQRLTIVRLSIDKLEYAAAQPAEMQVLLTKLKAEFSDVIESVRKTSRMLLPVHLSPNSFSESIRMLCQNLQLPGVGTINFESDGREHEIDAQSQAHLYRIVQELIHNAFKHSSAWNVWVRMKWRSDILTIEVEDDGSLVSKINDFIAELRQRKNTLMMRSQLVGAHLQFIPGAKGLLATVTRPVQHDSADLEL